MDNNNTYTIDIGRAGTVVHAIDDVVVAVTASNQVTNWVVEYNANRSGYTWVFLHAISMTAALDLIYNCTASKSRGLMTCGL